jgi:hypothetical protein
MDGGDAMPLGKGVMRALIRRAQRYPICLSLPVLPAIGLAILADAAPVRAQVSLVKPTIIIDTEMRITAGEDVPLAIGIANMEVLPPRSVVIIKGLPAAIRLSDGKSFGVGTWIIPINKLPQLKASIPAETPAKSEISVAIATLEGAYITEKRTALIVAPPSSPPPAVATTGSTPPVKEAPPQTPTAATPGFRVTGDSPELALKLMEVGSNSLKAGNVLVARQFFQHAAELGLADAAAALAGTYDAEELARNNLVDIQPDPDKAKKWRDIAQQLRSRDSAAQAR